MLSIWRSCYQPVRLPRNSGGFQRNVQPGRYSTPEVTHPTLVSDESVMSGTGRLSLNPNDRQLFNTISRETKSPNQRRMRIFQGDNEVSTVGIERLADIGFRWIGVRDGMRMVDAQMFLVGLPEILKELKQLSSVHGIPYIALQNVLHRPMVGDDLTRSRQQAAALAWCFLLGVPDNSFQDLSLDLNRHHKNKRPTRERLA